MNYFNVLNFIFPIKCGICGKIGNPICEKCENNINQLKIDLIEDENISVNCKNLKIQKIYVFRYDKKIRELLINYKFNDCSYLADSFAYLIKKDKKIYGILKSYDIIIPVPLHRKRFLERGYNQIELIAKKLEIPMETKCLLKIKNIKPQSTKNAEERKKDIKNTYILQNKDKVKNRKILILDDIYTTGSTANECIKTLSECTDKIGFLSIARDYMKL